MLRTAVVAASAAAKSEAIDADTLNNEDDTAAIDPDLRVASAETAVSLSETSVDKLEVNVASAA